MRCIRRISFESDVKTAFWTSEFNIDLEHSNIFINIRQHISWLNDTFSSQTAQAYRFFVKAEYHQYGLLTFENISLTRIWQIFLDCNWVIPRERICSLTNIMPLRANIWPSETAPDGSGESASQDTGLRGRCFEMYETSRDVLFWQHR